MGTLFAGLMIKDDSPSVVEFNVRFGDPETQVLLPLLEGDLHPVMLACVEGRLKDCPQALELKLKREAAVHVVMASGGYPAVDGNPMQLNSPIVFSNGEAEDFSVQRFFSGVREENGQLFNSGGRVLGITAVQKDRVKARHLVYGALKDISFAGAQWRGDIGK